MKFKAKQVIGAGLLAGAAGAATAAGVPDVTVYGVIDTGLVTTSHTGTGSQTKTGFADSILGVSNVGFKGTHDLGNGMEAFFNLQAGFNPTSGDQNAGAGHLFSRNAYVGLQGNLGSISVGKQWDLNDDWLVGSVFLGGYNSGAVFKFSEFDAVSDLYNNTVKYVSPSFGGVQGAGMISFQGNSADSKAGRIFNVGARYSTGGPLYGGITYYHEDDGSGSTPSTGATYQLTTVGGKYAMELLALRLGASFASISGPGSFQSIPSMSARRAQVVEAGVDYAFSSKFKASADLIYRHGRLSAVEDESAATSNHTAGARLLGVYNFTPDAALLLNIAYLKNGSGATEALVNTDSGLVGGGYANQSQTSVAIGARYAF